MTIINTNLTKIIATGLLGRTNGAITLVRTSQIKYNISNRAATGISTLRRLVCTSLVSRRNRRGTHLCKRSGLTTVTHLTSLVNTRDVSYSFRHGTGCAFTASRSNLRRIGSRIRTVRQLKLPNHFIRDISLPLDIAKTIVFPGRTRFRPHGFVLTLTTALPNSNDCIFRGAHIRAIRNRLPDRIVARGNPQVATRSIIVAAGLPVLSVKLCFTGARPRHSCLIKKQVSPDHTPRKVCVNINRNCQSVHAAPASSNNHLLVINNRNRGINDSRTASRHFVVLRHCLRSAFKITPRCH